MYQFIRFSIFFHTVLFVCNAYGQSVDIQGGSRAIGNWNTYYVWAKQGLVLRESPEKTGKKIAILPYGTKIESISQTSVPDSVVLIPRVFDNVPYYLYDSWVLVEVNQVKGYVFGGFLSKMPPFIPEKLPKEQYSSIDTWLAQTSGIATSVISSDYQHETTTIYNNQVTATVDAGEGGGSITYMFMNDNLVGFKDCLLLINYFEDIYYKKGDFDSSNPVLKVQKGEDFLSVYTEGLSGYIAYGFTITVCNYRVFISIGGGC